MARFVWVPVTPAALVLVPLADRRRRVEVRSRPLSPNAAARDAGKIEEAGVAFDETWPRLKVGRAYTAQQSGVVVFYARVERSVKTLLKWSAQDNDRTMLYAAEVKIKLTR